MTLRFASGVVLAGSLVVAPACQPEQAATPAPTLPPPPPPPTTPDPPVTRSLAVGFTGLYFIPGQPLVLAEGQSVFVDINWVGGDGFPQNAIAYQIVSDAPADELSATPSTVEVGPRVSNAGAVLVRAIADDRADEAPATYTLEVQPEGPLAEGWAHDLARAKMEVTVVEAEPTPPDDQSQAYSCPETRVQAFAEGGPRDGGDWMRSVHGDDLADYLTSTVTLQTAHPRTALSLVGPYRRPFAHREMEGEPPLYRPYPFGFLFDLALRETGGGFEQVMTLAWFDDVRLRLETPGCDALEGICEDGACRVR